MHRFDIHNRFAFATALQPSSTSDTTALVGAIIDTQGTDGTEFVVQAGALAATAPSFSVTLEHGDAADLSDAATVSGYDLLGGAVTFVKADANKAKSLGYAGIKRYVRVKVTPTVNDAAAAFSAVVVLRNRYQGYVG